MEKLDHIGIAVKNLEESNKLFAQLLGKEHYKIEEVEKEGVRTSFFEVGGFEVKDIDQSIKEYIGRDFKLTQPTPFRGADNKIVCFLHPKSTNGVLVELCQSLT
jgi:methylmalonyl-CoA/ethylmalonyl-CoA epimerase